MEIIELTADNIARYLDECVLLQEYLVTDKTGINRNFFELTAVDTHSYFACVIKDERVFGMGVLSKMSHPVDITGYVNNIVVHPEARGKGLFGLIMDDLEKRAADWGCTEMVLTCSRDAVQGMYEKRSYKKKDTNFYLLKI